MVRMVIRAPNHLGDFVMALPALYAAKPDAVIISSWLDPLARFAGFNTIPFQPGTRGIAAAAIELRRRKFGRGILLTPSFSSALMLRLGGVKSRGGTDTDRRGFLLTSKVDYKLLALDHRASVYMILATGDVPLSRPIPKLAVSREARGRFRNLVGTGVPLIGVFPGSNAPSRRWDEDRFAQVVEELSRDGRVVVFGSKSENMRTNAVAGKDAIDLGGKTDLPLLAAGLAECSLLVSNDSGPMHLAAAVGTRTVSLWGAGDPARTGPPPEHTVVRDTRLPCLECVKNVCPRKGKGYIIAEAHMECMKLLDVETVVSACREDPAATLFFPA